MRAIRTWGSVRGVLGDRHPYRDQRRDATGAPTQRPERTRRLGGETSPAVWSGKPFWRESGKSREREGSALASRKLSSDSVGQFVDAVLVRQLLGPHLRT
jgi:hypothetical protein